MKIKTTELTDAALDWAVCEAAGLLAAYPRVRKDFALQWPSTGNQHLHPSTDWAQGGPIIEREKLCVGHKHQADPEYCPVNDPATNCWARTTAGGYLSYGPTTLVAAMRCLVASKLGDEIEIPEELT